MNRTPEVIQVSPAYRHYEKVARCHGIINPAIGRLKWYEINRSDQPIEKAVRNLARSFVSRNLAENGSLSTQEFGFVFLHRCGEDFYFLGLCTWRENNELWKTQFFIETDTMDGFALYPQEGPHKDTYCVWELAAVCHEMQAWTTYLKSNRTEQDADRYLTAVI